MLEKKYVPNEKKCVPFVNILYSTGNRLFFRILRGIFAVNSKKIVWSWFFLKLYTIYN